MKLRYFKTLSLMLSVLSSAVNSQENETEITSVASSSETISDTTARVVEREIEISKFFDSLKKIQGDQKRKIDKVRKNLNSIVF